MHIFFYADFCIACTNSNFHSLTSLHFSLSLSHSLSPSLSPSPPPSLSPSLPPSHSLSLSPHRSEQEVVVRVEETEGGEGRGVVPYDYLVLCTGLQFELPPQLGQGEAPLIYDINEDQGVVEWVQENLPNG